MLSKIKKDQNVDTTGIQIEYCEPNKKTANIDYKTRFNFPVNRNGRKHAKNGKLKK